LVVSACELDVICVGHASYDHVFSVPHHPAADEKLFADTLVGCGGGPAANAAVTVARLGLKAGLAGYLGRDVHGQLHEAELRAEGVDTRYVVRGDAPTPVSVVLVKPDGTRTLVCYKGGTAKLDGTQLDLSGLTAKVALFDGHEPDVSELLLRGPQVTVLDAGSLHAGTEALMFCVDHLVCSEKFASQWLGESRPELALGQLAERAPVVVITLGQRGLIWRRGGESGALPAFPVNAVDTTGAGDAFHGAYAAALALELPWLDTLRFASAAGAACCEKLGARPGMPGRALLDRWLKA
jgi:sulfofructose kinase